MLGQPERGSDERAGWGGVTPCVVAPAHCLPTKCATFSPKSDRILTPRGCGGQTHLLRFLLFSGLALQYEIHVNVSDCSFKHTQQDWRDRAHTAVQLTAGDLKLNVPFHFSPIPTPVSLLSASTSQQMI